VAQAFIDLLLQPEHLDDNDLEKAEGKTLSIHDGRLE